MNRPTTAQFLESMKLPLNQLISMKLPKGFISPTGITQIQTLLEENYGYRMSLPDDWVWKWHVPTKHQVSRIDRNAESHAVTVVGTLPKRVAKFYYEVDDQPMKPQLLEHIGNIGRQHCSEDDLVFFDFSDQVDWDRGVFGDSASCLAKSAPYHISVLLSSSGGSMRTWKKNKKGEAPNTITSGYPGYPGFSPAGRCFFLPNWEQSGIILFNGYQGGRETSFFAHVLSLHLGLSYKRYAVESTQIGSLYINNARMFLVGSPELLIKTSSLGFDAAAPMIRPARICTDCHTSFVPGTTYLKQKNYTCEPCQKLHRRCYGCETKIRKNEPALTIDELLFHRSCYDSKVGVCYFCGFHSRIAEYAPWLTTIDGIYTRFACKSCKDKLFIAPECNHRLSIDVSNMPEPPKRACPGCFSGNTTTRQLYIFDINGYPQPKEMVLI